MDIYNVELLHSDTTCFVLATSQHSYIRASIKLCIRNFKVDVFFSHLRILIARLPYAGCRFPEFHSHCG